MEVVTMELIVLGFLYRNYRVKDTAAPTSNSAHTGIIGQ